MACIRSYYLIVSSSLVEEKKIVRKYPCAENAQSSFGIDLINNLLVM